MNSQTSVNLRQLAIDRTGTSTGSASPRRRWVSRYVLPGAILAGFAVLLGAAAGRQWLPKTHVSVVPVIVRRTAAQREGTPLFQAAGWIEPRPSVVNVAALAPGVIESLLVVEGQEVQQDEPIARLIDDDARIAVGQAKATLSVRTGELQQAEAAHAAAAARLAEPVHLKAQLAEANSALAKARTELDKLPFLQQAAEANVSFAANSLQGKRAARAAIAGVIIKKAEKDHAAALAQQQELQRRDGNLRHEIAALQNRANAVQLQLELLVDERRLEQVTRAKVQSAKALQDQARLHLELAELNLARTVVRAPMTGRVLRVLAAPGNRVMGMTHKASQNSSTVAQMYDPARLQVRADVRLEDVPLVTPGAPVRIETASSPTPLNGRVLLPTSSANIQKNTLEVKVQLIDPPAAVSPEMLVTATFLAPKAEAKDRAPVEADRLFVARQLVHTEGGTHRVWVVDAQGCAYAVEVQLGTIDADGLAEITGGLNPTDKVIASGAAELRAGQAVAIDGEDETMGMEQ